MIFEKNMALCKANYRNVYHLFESSENTQINYIAQVVPAKNGQLNIQVMHNEKTVFLHSTYNPENEALKWIEPYLANVGKTKHVLFFGIGMGYHVEMLMREFPDHTPFTMYEPFQEVLYRYLENRRLTDLPVKSLKNIFVGDSYQFFVRHFLEHFDHDVLIVINPAYERIFPQVVKQFSEVFRNEVRHKVMSVQTHYSYERIWTINAECNLLKVLRTPNMITDKKQFFQNKPVIIVAAGPSLEDEYEHLKEIKEKGLAFIFAVGSANKALLANHIIPDALVTYDPNHVNYEVYSEIIENKIIDIPLIFGSTVGFHTLELYPGPMLHFFNSQDHISPYYLSKPEAGGFASNEVVIDSASVAVMALQLVQRLESSLIILVGQNFSYRNLQYYVKGIEYNLRPTELSDTEKAKLVPVESVDGSIVYTEEVHNVARRQMEQAIEQCPAIKVINTTKQGAKINSADFIPLESVIKEYLDQRVVADNWHVIESVSYDIPTLLKRHSHMKKAYTDLLDLMQHIVKTIKKLELAAANSDFARTKKLLDEISRANVNLFGNKYYDVFLEPMVKVQCQIFQKSLTEINPIKNPLQKAKRIVQSFGPFILSCQEAIQLNNPFFALLDTKFTELYGNVDVLTNK